MLKAESSSSSDSSDSDSDSSDSLTYIVLIAQLRIPRLNSIKAVVVLRVLAF
jgi:hypothetical protein